MLKKDVSIPLLYEFDVIMESLDQTGKDVLILSLLDWCKKGDFSCAADILPTYLYKPFEQYKKVLLDYWKWEAE